MIEDSNIFKKYIYFSISHVTNMQRTLPFLPSFEDSKYMRFEISLTQYTFCTIKTYTLSLPFTLAPWSMSFIASLVFPSLHKSSNYEKKKKKEKEREKIIINYSRIQLFKRSIITFCSISISFDDVTLLSMWIWLYIAVEYTYYSPAQSLHRIKKHAGNLVSSTVQK